MDQSIEKYKIKGIFYIWEFKEPNPNMKSWNFTADKFGCDSVIQLLQLMGGSKYPSQKIINATTPTDRQISVPNNRNSQWHSKNFIELKYLNSQSKVWRLNSKSDTLEIVFDTPKLKELEQAIASLKAGNGDFAIGDDDDNNILYFWWNHEK